MGEVGGETQAQLTVTGDTVNVASRLQALTRDQGTAILASDALMEAGSADKLNLRGLQPERAPVFAGGVAILRAVFDGLEVRRMRRN